MLEERWNTMPKLNELTLEQKKELGGYAGKILRINLTDCTTEEISTYKYAPDYIGGRALASRIWWDEARPGVKAFDPDNKLIFMTGATTSTGVPTSPRCIFCGMSPTPIPEMYTWSSIGGHFGPTLKFAGYDGLIIEGRAEKPTYVVIDDDKITFEDAGEIWGKVIHDVEEWIFDKYGRDMYSVVTGPAGENLLRQAELTTANDNSASKAGFGAVFGSKNLKLIAVRGTGSIKVGNYDKMMYLRHDDEGLYGDYKPNPIQSQDYIQSYSNRFKVPGGYRQAWLCCGLGCTNRCNRMMLDCRDPFQEGNTINQVEKCVSSENGYGFEYDYGCMVSVNYETEYNRVTSAMLFAGALPNMDDPDIDELTAFYPGNKFNYWRPNYERSLVALNLCTQYGIDKWEWLVWYTTWLSAAKQEGLLDGIDFGMEVDVEDEAFLRHFFELIVYRKGPDYTLPDGTVRPIGDILAEGIGRAVRLMGKEKFGDSIYHNSWTNDGSEARPIPVSLEQGWGYSSHWSGRGFHPLNKSQWLANNMQHMISTRDAQTDAHFHDTLENWRSYRDDPTHSDLMAQNEVRNDVYGEIKESVSGCEWSTEYIWWTSMYAEMFSAGIGLDVSEEELYEAGMRGRLIFRAILMRDHHRTRDMEVEEMFPWLTFPDFHNQVATWDEWNDCVDRLYTAYGWDIETGWPYRSTWEKYGLKDIADYFEERGMLPPEGGNPDYVRKECPFVEGGHHKRKADVGRDPLEVIKEQVERAY